MDMEKEQIVLLGAGEHAKVVMDCVIDSGKELTAIFDDDQELVSLNGYSVDGPYSEDYLPEIPLIITVGNNHTRKKIASIIKHDFGVVIHPSASVSNYARVGAGTVVIHGSIIQSGARIGKHCIINTNASVDHDCHLGDYVHISPRVAICGDVHIGEGSHIGAGATILPGVKIGKWCVIGAGAVINKSMPDQSLVVGVPGKIIRQLDQE